MNIRSVKFFLFVLILALGLATIIVTIANGGGVTSRGILFGTILCLMAIVRIYLTLRHDA